METTFSTKAKVKLQRKSTGNRDKNKKEKREKDVLRTKNPPSKKVKYTKKF